MAGILDSTELIGRLRRLRKMRGMAQQALADRTGIPRPVIANLESGRREGISFDEARLICEALDADLRVVISDEPMVATTAVHVI
jgi:transcriptional regulator with XRE-family HTH domain